MKGRKGRSHNRGVEVVGGRRGEGQEGILTTGGHTHNKAHTIPAKWKHHCGSIGLGRPPNTNIPRRTSHQPRPTPRHQHTMQNLSPASADPLTPTYHAEPLTSHHPNLLLPHTPHQPPPQPATATHPSPTAAPPHNCNRLPPPPRYSLPPRPPLQPPPSLADV